MIKYGSESVAELTFTDFNANIVQRDRQWVDIEIRFGLKDGMSAPDDLIDLTALVICSLEGMIAQIVPQDEGIDCEYQFTAFEKDQIRTYVESAELQAQIDKLVSL